MTQQEIDKIRDKDIVQYLNGRGIEPGRKTKTTYFYHSFFQNERTPSLAVSLSKNRFKCFSTGERGDIIDLHMHFEKMSFKEAINDLAENKVYKNIKQTISVPSDPIVIIDRITDIKTKYLINYIESRKIPLDLARIYCREVTYHFHIDMNVEHKQYKAVGFRNDRGGFEIRNKYWKGGSAPKTITTIKGKSKSKGKINVFEGFFNFLSALIHFDTETPSFDTVVLNSESLLSKLDKDKEYYIFMDNKGNVDKLLKKHKLNHVDCRDVFYPYEDFNDFLINTK